VSGSFPFNRITQMLRAVQLRRRNSFEGDKRIGLLRPVTIHGGCQKPGDMTVTGEYL
jgi:hypothetical protein